MSPRKHYLIPIITITYILLILIGSIYPFTDWHWPTEGGWLDSFENTTRYVPRSDFIVNFLIYIPLGALASILLQNRINLYFLLLTSTCVASGIGATMELLQLFIPSRAHSLIDLSMNASGALAGALTHHFTKKHSILGKHLRQIRYKWFKKGRYSELGLVIIAIWALSELSPLAPSLDLNTIILDYNNFTKDLFNLSAWNYFSIMAFALEIFALFLIIELVLKAKSNCLIIFGAFACMIIYMKLPVADTHLSAEHFWGLIIGIALNFSLQNRTIELRTKLVMYALFLTYLINQLNHPAQLPTDSLNTFNWLPFDSDAKRINRVTEILNITWIFLALSFLTLSIKQKKLKRNGAIGLIVATIVALILEWQQQTLQNSSADITDVLVAMFAWSLPYFHPEIRKGVNHQQ